MSLNKAQQTVVAKVVKDTLEFIQQQEPKHYKELSNAQRESLANVAKSAASEHVRLAQHLKGEPDDIETILKAHLPEHRIDLLKGGLAIPTFRMTIKQNMDDGKYEAHYTKNGEKYLDTRYLTSNIAIDNSDVKQWGSIVVEAVMLVMSAVGISVSPSSHSIEQAVDETVHVIQTSSKFAKALEDFKEAWDDAGGNKFEMAAALFYLIKETYTAKLLWTIIKSICSNMAWYEWLETAAKVTATIIAALATDGAALIAEIALVVLSAFDFVRKLANISHLKNIREQLDL